MPWTAKDAMGHTEEADTPAMQTMWAEVANSTRQRELAKGTPAAECDAIAIRTANAAVAAKAESHRKTREEVTFMTTETILEFVDSRGVKLRVDRERGVIEGVKVLGLASRNSRTYPKETAARAVGLYEASKVNVNHPKGNPSGPRDYQDRIGVLRNVRVERGDGGLRGDFHFNPKHALAEQLMWDAEHAPENVGFSHNVEAKIGRKNGKTIVEEIIKVQSVDLVADPATTRGLFEETETQNRKEDTLDYKELTEETLAAERPDLLQAIATKALAEHADSEAEKAKDATIKTLTEQVDALKARESHAALKAAVENELTEAKLPATLVSEVFRQQLLTAKDGDARKVLIEDRRKLAGTKPQSKEQSKAGDDLLESAIPTGDAFVSAITE